MAEQKKELTKEEKAKIEASEKLRKDRVGNLESLLGYAGARYLKGPGAHYGAEGSQAGNFAFGQFLSSDKANSIRKNVYGSKLEEAAQYETISQPEYTSNYELEKASLGLIADAQANLTLGDLEKVVKGKLPGVMQYNIPDKFKGKNALEIQKKISDSVMKLQEELMKYKNQLDKKEIDENKYQELVEGLKKKTYQPNADEQAVLKFADDLHAFYEKGSAIMLLQMSEFGKMNEEGKALSEKYKPKEDKSTDGKKK